MRRVLIIDDEPDNLTVVSEMLSPSFEVYAVPSGREGIQAAVRLQPQAIILDINMPEMDGFEVCKRLREQPSTRLIPVIMLTAAGELDSRVKGLDMGADDYVTKPFQTRELIARVNARIRRMEIEKTDQEEIRIGNLQMDPRQCSVQIDGKPVRLTQMEFEILKYFLRRPNQVIPRNKFLSDLWPDAVVSDRTVDTHIANLRKKISGFVHPLATIYGAGYILKTESSDSGEGHSSF